MESLAGRLSFDSALAQSACAEIEDHLRQAAAADPAGGTEAERRVVARFGDAHVIAAQLAATALARRARDVGLAVIAVLVGVFIAMKARLAWYAVAPGALSDAAHSLSALVASIDRATFWLAILAGISAWAYSRWRGARLRRFYFACAIAVSALVASVVCDGILTALRLASMERSLDYVVPALSMAIETACATVLVLYFGGSARRTTAGAALLAA